MNIEPIVPVMKKASGWVIIWGIVTFVCGVLAIILPLTFSFGIALIIGCLVLVAAIAHLFFAFQTRSVDGFLWQMLVRSSGNLPIGEPAFECSFADPNPGDSSSPGGHFGTRPLFRSQTIPSLRLGAD